MGMTLHFGGDENILKKEVMFEQYAQDAFELYA